MTFASASRHCPAGCLRQAIFASLGSDIPTREGWLDLAVVTALFSGAISVLKIADSLHAEVVTGALQNALRADHIAATAIFHSDRGCPCTASSTRALLRKHGLLQSMSAAESYHDNTFAESTFASFKAELPHTKSPPPSNRLPALPASMTSRSSPTISAAILPLASTLPSISSKSTSLPKTKLQTNLHLTSPLFRATSRVSFYPVMDLRHARFPSASFPRAETMRLA